MFLQSEKMKVERLMMNLKKLQNFYQQNFTFLNVGVVRAIIAAAFSLIWEFNRFRSSLANNESKDTSFASTNLINYYA